MSENKTLPPPRKLKELPLFPGIAERTKNAIKYLSIYKIDPLAENPPVRLPTQYDKDLTLLQLGLILPPGLYRVYPRDQAGGNVSNLKKIVEVKEGNGLELSETELVGLIDRNKNLPKYQTVAIGAERMTENENHNHQQQTQNAQKQPPTVATQTVVNVQQPAPPPPPPPPKEPEIPIETDKAGNAQIGQGRVISTTNVEALRQVSSPAAEYEPGKVVLVKGLDAYFSQALAIEQGREIRVEQKIEKALEWGTRQAEILRLNYTNQIKELQMQHREDLKEERTRYEALQGTFVELVGKVAGGKTDGVLEFDRLREEIRNKNTEITDLKKQLRDQESENHTLRMKNLDLTLDVKKGQQNFDWKPYIDKAIPFLEKVGDLAAPYLPGKVGDIMAENLAEKVHKETMKTVFEEKIKPHAQKLAVEQLLTEKARHFLTVTSTKQANEMIDQLAAQDPSIAQALQAYLVRTGQAKAFVLPEIMPLDPIPETNPQPLPQEPTK